MFRLVWAGWAYSWIHRSPVQRDIERTDIKQFCGHKWASYRATIFLYWLPFYDTGKRLITWIFICGAQKTNFNVKFFSKYWYLQFSAVANFHDQVNVKPPCAVKMNRNDDWIPSKIKNNDRTVGILCFILDIWNLWKLKLAVQNVLQRASNCFNGERVPKTQLKILVNIMLGETIRLASDEICFVES